MGYIKHHSIAVTSWDNELISKAHDKANKIFDGLVTEIIGTKVNSYHSFFISTDGSKEGWEESDNGDVNRTDFIKWLNEQAHEDGSSSISYAEFFYGDDNGDSKVINHN